MFQEIVIIDSHNFAFLSTDKVLVYNEESLLQLSSLGGDSSKSQDSQNFELVPA